MGRPTKLTASLQKELCAYLANGAPVKWACMGVGISTPTFYDWRSIGEEWRDAPATGKGAAPAQARRCVEFLSATDKAMAQGKLVPVLELMKMARDGRTDERVRARIFMFLLTHGDRENWRPAAAEPPSPVQDEVEILLEWPD